jgi:hypothetical protein
MEQTKYTINEFGEITREDYFFTSVQGDSPQILPTNRKVWKIWLLSLITFGIYGFVVMFAMGKETNIACAEDGKHTMNFWGALLLSIITLGIYGFVWYYKWANREYEYLGRHTKEGGILSGSGFIGLMFVTFIIAIAEQIVSINMGVDVAYWALYILSLIWNYIVMSKYVKQHNNVCKAYNINTFGKKA